MTPSAAFGALRQADAGVLSVAQAIIDADRWASPGAAR